jgi:hypothetical protein
MASNELAETLLPTVFHAAGDPISMAKGMLDFVKTSRAARKTKQESDVEQNIRYLDAEDVFHHRKFSYFSPRREQIEDTFLERLTRSFYQRSCQVSHF